MQGHDYVIQLKSLIAMSFIVLSYTVLSKNRFSFMDAAFCLMSVAYVGIGFMFFYETRSEGLHYILYAFLIVSSFYRITVGSDWQAFPHDKSR